MPSRMWTRDKQQKRMLKPRQFKCSEKKERKAKPEINKKYVVLLDVPPINFGKTIGLPAPTWLAQCFCITYDSNAKLPLKNLKALTFLKTALFVLIKKKKKMKKVKKAAKHRNNMAA